MEREYPHEAESDIWLLVYAFADEEAALRAYEAAREAVLGDGLAASVFRFLLDRQSFVAVISEASPSDATDARFQELLSPGEPSENSLPQAVLQELTRRRRSFRASGRTYLERRSDIYQTPRDGEV